MKYVLLLAVAAIGFTACKKKTVTYKVDGVITDDSYAQPLSGATVQLYEVPVGGTSPTNVLATATTGADGKYHFEFKREKIQEYVIKITKTNYFPLSKTFSADDLSTSATNTFTHNTTAKAWIKLHFVNTDATDNLKFIRQEGKMNCDECCTTGEQFLYGIIDTSIYCINDGNTTYGYYYWVLGTANNGPKSAVTTAFDTTELLLNY